MTYRAHPALESFGRAIDRNGADTVGALFALGMMLDERLSDLTEGVLGGQTIGTVSVHEETLETRIVPSEAGEHPLIETSELEDGSIAITVLRSEDHTPAAQICMTKQRALELGKHFVEQLACRECNGAGQITHTGTTYWPCIRCNASGLDPEV